jgi:hypothetical protein
MDETRYVVPADGNVSQRKKMVNIGISFVCDTDSEAIAVKEKVNAIIADNPAIQLLFSIVERPTTQGA